MSTLRLGTRGSTLALAQSRLVKEALEAAGDVAVSLEVIRTTGDRLQDRPLPEIGGKGLFTRELDRSLLDGQVDLAVHSLKDLPTEIPGGLSLGAVPEREDPRDVLIGSSPGETTLKGLPEGARVGTSSLRRQALARAFRPDLDPTSIRGNLDTRIEKVERGDVDAIVVAAAGVNRMGAQDRVGEWLERTVWLPAPGQGALALVVRTHDAATRELVAALDHPSTRAAVESERRLLALLEGGCRLPIAALGLPFDGGLRLWALVASPDGRRVVRSDRTGRLEEPDELAREVADVLIRRGAREILDRIEDADVSSLSHP